MSSDDIDWLIAAGKVQEWLPNQEVTQSSNFSNQVGLLLDGQFTIALPYQAKDSLKEFAQLSRDVWVGVVPSLEAFLSTATLQAKTRCQWLAIDPIQLADKLAQDATFTAHFYQYQAVLIMQRLQALIMQFKLHPTVLYQTNIKEASSLFAELQASDLDWLIAVGQRQQLPSASVLQTTDRPIEALQIVLEGALSLSVPSEPSNNLADVLFPVSTLQEPEEIARLARGDVFGEMQLIQPKFGMFNHRVQVQTIRDTEILSIPRWRIVSKLLHDSEFATHFYQVLAVLLAGKYQTILSRLGFIVQAEESSSDRVLTKVARAETNFEWMLQRIQTKVVTGRTIQW
ncbi:MAG: hypothetical protein HC780_22945 [Leptolyngbyaceae cyanobacterium CSU_1_3]|nr:hypothetical protein [Leptolyngbyaceae cyanobacterium CSU_1_3]